MYLNIRKSSKIALIDDSKSINYNDLITNVNLLSSYIEKRSLVFCLLDNDIDSVISYISVIEANSVPLLLSSDISINLLDSLIKEYRPKYIISKTADNRFEDYEVKEKIFSLTIHQTEYPIYNLNRNLELLLTTSGSTGSPKLVRHKKGNIESNALNIALAFGWDESEIGLLDLPINYTMGLSTVNTHLFLGATCIITNSSPISKKYWELLQEKNVTNIVGVPFSYELLDKMKFTTYELPYLKSICQGGGKLSKSLFNKLADYASKNNKKFFATYGATETTARMTFLSPEQAINKTQSIGQPIPLGVSYLINTDDNRGELCFQGPNVTMGYAKKRSDLNLGDTWKGVYRTGDIVEIDEDGDMVIVGRLKRFLKLSGHRVSLDDVENIIKNQFGYTAVCVGNDKKMTIFISLDSEEEAKNIKKFLSDELSLYHSLFEIRNESELKRKENGKIDYGYYNSILL